MASLLLPPISNLLSSSTLAFPHNALHVLHSQLPLKPSKKNPKSIQNNTSRSPICSALAESDSPKSAQQQDIQTLIQDLSNSLTLPPDYFSQLPRDLRLDLNDAAFDLANGPVPDECGQELGEALLNLSRAWELADTSTSNSIASKLPSLTLTLTDSAKFALGKRLVASGRRFQSMGQYGEGELQRISKAMIQTGRLLSALPVSTTDKEPKTETRMFKFGELQVELTPEKANIGAAIGVVFGFLSWELAQGIQSIPESSLQYANDNADLLAKSLRGALLVIGYSSTILSASASVGLILLGLQLRKRISKISKPLDAILSCVPVKQAVSPCVYSSVSDASP
ncbi:hypothetical protein Sjap_006153 [Stephania japonica]|uniref:LOW protein: ammonium transporter 1-like protein n=1 Tax=Stephania japonica TaxID=461633 RepID=A0AAP0K7X5_9MAGN